MWDRTYDAVKEDSNQTIKSAKLGLLNLYTKMSNMIEPTGKKKVNWFSFVERVIEIAQSRMIALVSLEMGDIVEEIRQDIGKFDDYEKAFAKNHFDEHACRIRG